MLYLKALMYKEELLRSFSVVTDTCGYFETFLKGDYYLRTIYFIWPPVRSSVKEINN